MAHTGAAFRATARNVAKVILAAGVPSIARGDPETSSNSISQIRSGRGGACAPDADAPDTDAAGGDRFNIGRIIQRKCQHTIINQNKIVSGAMHFGERDFHISI